MNEQNINDIQSRKDARNMAKIESSKILFQIGFFSSDDKFREITLSNTRLIYNNIFGKFDKSESHMDLYFAIKTMEYMLYSMNVFVDKKESGAEIIKCRSKS
jgi:hypothetical protein